MKRPAFQFYPADWRKDVELQSCSMAAQGLWINVMCIAHECEPYGHLTINSKPMTSAQLGRQVGLSAKETDVLVAELEDAGVVARSAEGCLFSRRMVKDERLRNIRSDAGRLGGNPNLVKQEVKQVVNHEVNQTDNQSLKQSPTPSSSSSTSVYSEAKASGGEPPVKPSVDKSKTELWKSAVSLLEGQGMPEPQARSLIGKLSKDYKSAGEDIVLTAVQGAVAEQPADARAYLKATCQRLAGERKRDGSHDWTTAAL